MLFPAKQSTITQLPAAALSSTTKLCALQGVFVKRHQVDKEDGSPFTPADLAVGQTVTVYGRTYILIDADAFTRTWYAEKMDQQLAAPGDYPGDPVDDYRQRFALTTAPGALKLPGEHNAWFAGNRCCRRVGQG